MRKINFTKSHGLGNDFIIIEDLKDSWAITDAMARALCDRRFGIGADGLIVARKGEKADFFMDLRNADGSAAEMSGNGIRVLAKYIYERLAPQPVIDIETPAGVKSVEIKTVDGLVEEAKVDMGEPVFAAGKVPVVIDGPDFIDRPVIVNGNTYKVTCLSMGNPHCVVFVPDVKAADVAGDGKALENLDIFPNRTNVEFVQAIGRNRLRVRVWERGVGETPACGTGACAAVVAAAVNGVADREAAVDLPGGQLSIVWGADEHVTLAGPVSEVFTGELDLDSLPRQGEPG